jgi:hypothetical protein
MRGGLRASLGLGGAAALVAGVFFGGRAMERASAKRAAASAWARFARCLVGDEPPRTTDPRERIRAIELGVAARKASGVPHERDARWPERCADYERKLDTAWAAVDEPGVVRTQATSYEATLAKGQAPSLVIDSDFLSLWSDARRLGPGDDVAGVLAAPPPADVVLRESFAGDRFTVRMGTEPLTPVSSEGIVTEGDPVFGRSLLLRFYQEDEVCVFAGDDDAARTLLRARCHPVSPSVPRGTSRGLVGLDDGAAPIIAVFDYERGGVYSVDSGERLVAAGTPTDEGAWGRANGFVATLDRALVGKGFSDTFTLVRRLPGGASSRTPLDRPRYVDGHVFDAHVIGGHILWLEGPSLEHDTELYARAILEGDPAVGPIVHVGTIPAGFRIGKDAVACRTREALFVELSDIGGHGLVVARKGSEWLPSQPSSFTGGRLTCRGSEWTLTEVNPAGAASRADDSQHPLEVQQTRCTLLDLPGDGGQRVGCRRSSVHLTSVTTRWTAIDAKKVVATDLGGQVALVTLGDAVLLRSAAIDGLEHAPVTVIADADEHRVGGMRVHEAYVPTRGDAAVLLLNTDRGSLALRLGSGAALAPVTVERSTAQAGRVP